ncbi:MAG: segregation and condensation protein [Planctomycetota bacterium]
MYDLAERGKIAAILLDCAAMSQNDWLVRLPVFQGPLDLLLFLVRRAEVDIHDIPIHTLTDQYLEYCRHLSRIDIDVAGEFLVMAATLVEIKSRSLAPVVTPEEGGDGTASNASGDDPRAELIKQLLAYQKFRTAAEVLEARRKDFAERAAARARPGIVESDGDAERADQELEDFELEDLHLGDLFAAFERIAASIDLTRVGDHMVEYDDTPISLHQEDIVDRLTRIDAHRLTLGSVFDGRTHSERIGLFLALLELVRQGRVRVRQDDLDDDIDVTLAEERGPDAPTF